MDAKQKLLNLLSDTNDQSLIEALLETAQTYGKAKLDMVVNVEHAKTEAQRITQGFSNLSNGRIYERVANEENKTIGHVKKTPSGFITRKSGWTWQYSHSFNTLEEAVSSLL